MAHVVFDCFPGGRRKALHMSYDDGKVEDRRLVEIFNHHGIRGTFHLNSGHLDRDGYLCSDEIAALFAGHEVGTHTVTHPCLTHLPAEGIIHEILDDRRALERLLGYVVRGMSYPGGDVDERVVAMLPHLGIAYSRSVEVRKPFTIPDDFYRWPMSCHHSQSLERADEFLQIPSQWGLQLFYVMGHSYEFDSADKWKLIEDFCAKMGGREEIWYATNIEIADYIHAMRAVQVSVDGDILTNHTAISIWCSVWEGGKPLRELEIPVGGTVRLAGIIPNS